jgi:phospholipid-binding lipoprotein MlaA
VRAAAVVLAALAISGCVAQSASIHTLPPEDPAAENAEAAESAAAFAAASAVTEGGATAVTRGGDKGGGATATGRATEPAVTPFTPQEAPPMQTYDPWERLNRFTYRFNARFDEAVFLPVANAYRRAPAPLRAGVHNFFGNLSEVDSVINYALQGRFRLGVRSLERFAINSTLGIGGLMDVAKKLKLPGARTGLGTTFAKWGMHPGPYLVVPVLGPTTFRDGLGFAGDYATSYAIDIARLYRGYASWGLTTLNAVDQRATTAFRYYSSGSAFEYENVRFLYVRKTLIEDDALHARGVKSAPERGNPQEPAGK